MLSPKTPRVFNSVLTFLQMSLKQILRSFVFYLHPFIGIHAIRGKTRHPAPISDPPTGLFPHPGFQDCGEQSAQLQISIITQLHASEKPKANMPLIDIFEAEHQPLNTNLGSSAILHVVIDHTRLYPTVRPNMVVELRPIYETTLDEGTVLQTRETLRYTSEAIKSHIESEYGDWRLAWSIIDKSKMEARAKSLVTDWKSKLSQTLSGPDPAMSFGSSIKVDVLTQLEWKARLRHLETESSRRAGLMGGSVVTST